MFYTSLLPYSVKLKAFFQFMFKSILLYSIHLMATPYQNQMKKKNQLEELVHMYLLYITKRITYFKFHLYGIGVYYKKYF